MASKTSERLRWVVDALEVEPDDRLLEIGCGPGVAVSLVCGRLVRGHIMAIDRSLKMADMARKRNAKHVAAGRATVLAADLSDVLPGDQKFNKIFASHVNVFWQKPQEALAIVRELLTPTGVFYLLFQPLDSSNVRNAITQATANLEANGFTVAGVKCEVIKGGPIVCLSARAS